MTPVKEAPLVELSELILTRPGSVNPKSFLEETFELFSIPAFDLGAAECALGREIGSSKQNVQPGDVLLSKIVPHIRRSWIVTPDQGFRQIASGEWIIFRDPRIHGPYLRQLLVSDHFNMQFMQTVAGVGGSLLRARPAHVAKIHIPLPPLAEQRRIAAILDKAEHLRTQRREALALLDNLSQSIFNDLATHSIHSPTMLLEALVAPGRSKIRTGPFGSQLLTSEFVEEGIAVLGIDNAVSNTFEWKQRRYITHEKYEQLERYTVYPGDLIISIMGTLGRCAVIPDDIPTAINTKHLCCITLNHDLVIPEYVHAYFLHHKDAARHLRQTTKGSIMAGLNMSIIKAMPIVVPPLELQQKFANQVTCIEKLKEQHRAHLAELDALFASLQHRAFSGQL